MQSLAVLVPLAVVVVVEVGRLIAEGLKGWGEPYKDGGWTVEMLP